MEGLSTNAYRALRNYWRRRGYRRLNNAVARPGPSPDPTRVRRRRSWRVKIGKKIRIWNRTGSPKKWMIRLRDGYEKMMLNLANSSRLGSVGYGGSVGDGCGFGSGRVKEYDEKVIVEMYKSVVMGQAYLEPHRQTAKA